MMNGNKEYSTTSHLPISIQYINSSQTYSKLLLISEVMDFNNSQDNFSYLHLEII